MLDGDGVTYELGQCFPPPPARGIVRGGPARWHALIVYPQREDAAKAWLGRFDVDAFFPVEEVFRWKFNRMMRATRKYVPGYLFAHFAGQPLWHRILDHEAGSDRRLIRDVIRMSDGVTPGVLHPETLVRLEGMRDVHREIETRKQVRRALRIGDVARLNSGAYVGSEVEIVRIDTTRGVAKFEIKLIGWKGEAALDTLDKVEDR